MRGGEGIAIHECGDVKIKIGEVTVGGEVPILPTWQFAENSSSYSERVCFPCLQGRAAQFIISFQFLWGYMDQRTAKSCSYRGF